ncbi:hypothetical protein [Sediminibacterium ginsengisoli]|uniref:Uncharacterized protein n=1 Tax=Sediminibacterium ginsengisoli TaxID=413434 RepID=A0A1T4RT84_9BACT|nr:hypothetical protein [Sediminibacterium ginsengisoli]SKA19179.1 hypothetical protein SAMN04488132_11472 [Sediminibacterium ginsengisoli]
MKAKLIGVIATLLLFVYVPAKSVSSHVLAPPIVHAGHFVSMATDGNYYQVDFSFNLSTQAFGYIDVTPLSGSGGPFTGTVVAGSASSIPSGGSGINTSISPLLTIEFTRSGSLHAVYADPDQYIPWDF